MGRVPTAIVDPNSLFRGGLSRQLSESFCSLVSVVGQVSDLPSYLPRNDQMLFVIGSDGGSGLGAIEHVSRNFPAARILVVSDTCESQDICEALRRGANGYMPRSTNIQVLLRSLQLILENNVLIAPAGPTCASLMQSLADETPRWPPTVPSPIAAEMLNSIEEKCDMLRKRHNISGREFNVILLMAKGCPNKIIAHRLDISEATVKAHVKAILRKIGVKNRTQAAIWAIDHGFAQVSETAATQPVKPVSVMPISNGVRFARPAEVVP